MPEYKVGSDKKMSKTEVGVFVLKSHWAQTMQTSPSFANKPNIAFIRWYKVQIILTAVKFVGRLIMNTYHT